jgi:hypothetical protein
VSGELRQRPGDQPLPNTADPSAPGMHDKAIEMLRQRRNLGLTRYGSTLQPFNGRNTRRDVEEEAADWFVYFLAYLEEQEQRIEAAARQAAAEALRAGGEDLLVQGYSVAGPDLIRRAERVEAGEIHWAS